MVDGVSIIFAKRMSSYSKKLSQENNGDNKKNEVFDNMIQIRLRIFPGEENGVVKHCH